MPYNVRDSLMKATIALPATATTVHSSTIDLGAPTAGAAPATDFVAECELLVSAPALNTTQLPSAATVTYIVEQSADGSTSFTTLAPSLIVQTGSASSGAAAATAWYRLPTNVQRYIRVSATSASTPGDCSAASVSLEVLF
jgi:hypothetical protein